MEKQTAVEWLEFEIYKRGPKEDNPPQWLKELYDQAKEMHKQEIIDACEDGHYSFSSFSTRNADQYHKETFGGTDII